MIRERNYVPIDLMSEFELDVHYDIVDYVSDIYGSDVAVDMCRNPAAYNKFSELFWHHKGVH